MSRLGWVRALPLVVTLVTAVPSFAADWDISELLDPAVLTQEICGRDVASPAPSEFTQLAALPTRDPPGTRPPLWPGLGSWTFKISSAVPDTQAYFDQGLRLTYAFNHGEAIRAFRAAQEIDPHCAICFWGEALALGPNINEPMTSDANKLALKAIAHASKLIASAAPKERALIEALTARYAKSHKVKRETLDAAYADAMAKVRAAYPDDADVAALLVDADLNATPRPWWAKDGTPLGRTADAVGVLESVLAVHPEHPGAVHFYIHIMEPSATPEKAERYADTLASLMPAAGHMVHMPSHIYFRIGRYKDSVATNVAAVTADEALLAQTPNATERYRHGYYPHNIHMAMASADMAGDAATALKMADKLLASLPGGKFREDMYTAAALTPHVRFDAPDQILALPKPNKKMPLAVGMWFYARASAFAWKKDMDSARAEVDALTKLRTSHKMMKNKDEARARTQLEIADHVARARIAIAAADFTAARAELEAAITLGDQNSFWRGDPPGWDFPIRQALGILLLQTGHAADAAPILREALMDAPNNAWVLFALQRASVLNGDTLGAQEYGKLFARAWTGSVPPDLGRI